MMNIPADLERAVVHLNNAYVRSLDEDRLEQWPALFVPDCRYAIQPRENRDAGLEGYWMEFHGQAMLRDRVTSLRHANIYNIHRDRHLLSTVEVHAERAGAYVCTASYLVIQTDVEGHSRLFSTGEYQDLIVSTTEGLRFKERLVIVDTFNVEGMVAIPL